MPETTFRQTEGKRFSCPKCGGGLQYDIVSGQMKCDHCGDLTPVESLPEPAANDTSIEVTEFRCPQCGAAVYSSDTAMTSFCSFCGSDVILTAKLTRTKRPARIVPFSVTREQCEGRYRSHLSRYHLVPPGLKAAETISHFRAVYVPFWSYHVKSEGSASLKATKSYTRGNTRYDETYALTIDAKIDQRDILYDASAAFEDETAAMLRHTTDHSRPFHPAYLSGFFAQAADVPADTYYAEAAATAVRLFIDKVKKENQFDTVTTEGGAGNNFGLPNAQFEQQLLMLPVWLLAHRESDRVVYTAINGCTGEVVCDVPVSTQRVVAVIAGISLAIFAALFFLLNLKPDLLMVLCAVLALITQYRFSAMHQMLYNRKTRAYEPDFSGEKHVFVGPAQLLLKKGGQQTTTDKVKKVGVAVISFVVIAIGFIGMRTAGNLIQAVIEEGALSSDALLTFAMGLVLLIMLIHTVRRFTKPGSGTPIPRAASCLICGVGLYFLLSKQAEDMLFYGCTIGLLLSAVWELFLIIRGHNEYASRPVPYFDGKENQV